jgi:hypothetical protein
VIAGRWKGRLGRAEAVEAVIAGEAKLDAHTLRADFPIFQQRIHGEPRLRLHRPRAGPPRSSFASSQSCLRRLEDFRRMALTVCLIKRATAHGVITIGASRPLAFRSTTRSILRR